MAFQGEIILQNTLFKAHTDDATYIEVRFNGWRWVFRLNRGKHVLHCCYIEIQSCIIL